MIIFATRGFLLKALLSVASIIGGTSSKNLSVAKTKHMKSTSAQIEAQSSLAQKVSTYLKSEKGVKFKKMRDGFAINGDDVYLDPEGEIVNYGYNWKDGSFTYIIKLSKTEFKIKFNRVESNKESIDIANLTRKGSSFFVETKTGEKFRGKGLILTSKGFIVTRNNSAFIYTAGEKTKQFTAPSGWHIAYFQNGDVASIFFYLKCKGKHRGYIEKMVIGGDNGDKVTPIKVTIITEDASKSK